MKGNTYSLKETASQKYDNNLVYDDNMQNKLREQILNFASSRRPFWRFCTSSSISCNIFCFEDHFSVFGVDSSFFLRDCLEVFFGVSIYSALFLRDDRFGSSLWIWGVPRLLRWLLVITPVANPVSTASWRSKRLDFLPLCEFSLLSKSTGDMALSMLSISSRPSNDVLDMSSSKRTLVDFFPDFLFADLSMLRPGVASKLMGFFCGVCCRNK